MVCDLRTIVFVLEFGHQVLFPNKYCISVIVAMPSTEMGSI